MSKILVTLQNYDFKPNEKYYFLGFCGHEKKVALKDKNVSFFEEKLSINDKLKIYKYCENISEKIINNLTGVLNNLHGENYYPRIWKFIYGRWLNDFIYVSYKYFQE